MWMLSHVSLLIAENHAEPQANTQAKTQALKHIPTSAFARMQLHRLENKIDHPYSWLQVIPDHNLLGYIKHLYKIISSILQTTKCGWKMFLILEHIKHPNE